MTNGSNPADVYNKVKTEATARFQTNEQREVLINSNNLADVNNKDKTGATTQ